MRYLVVAHRTLGSPSLTEEIRARHQAAPSTFHLLVPVAHPSGHMWTEAEVERAARSALDHALDDLRSEGIDATGEIGDVNPLYAIHTLFRRDGDFDEILLSTLPSGPSRWLKWDVPTRVRTQFDLPVSHVVTERHHARSGGS